MNEIQPVSTQLAKLMEQVAELEAEIAKRSRDCTHHMLARRFRSDAPSLYYCGFCSKAFAVEPMKS